MEGSFWPKDSLIIYIVFELYLIWYISPVANFGTHSLNAKTPNFFLTFDFFIHLKKENFFLLVFLSPLFKMYKNVVKFSFTQQKMFWVLVFSIRIRYLAYPTDRSFDSFLAGLSRYWVHVALTKPPVNQFKLVLKSWKQALRAYCSNINTVREGQSCKLVGHYWQGWRLAFDR